MDATFKAILSVLSSGDKTSSEIATELGLSPAKMTALLSTLVSRQEVKKVGKIRSNGKDVSKYAHASMDEHAPVISEQRDTDFEFALRLHRAWGGYLSEDARPSKKRLALKHRME